MKKFSQFYLWALNWKLRMGLYFCAIVLIVGFVLWLLGNQPLTFIVIVEILGTSMLISFLEWAILNGYDYEKGIISPKTLAWSLSSGCIVGLVCHFGNWFNGLLNVGGILMGVVFTIACLFVLIGYKWEQEEDSEVLNKQLKKYQEGK